MNHSPAQQALRIAAGILLLLLAVVAGWWLGARSAPQNGATPVDAAETALNDASAAMAGNTSADPFAFLECTARLFDDAPALAVTFTQPLATDQDWARLLKVSDLGPARDGDKDSDNSDTTDTTTKPAAGPVNGGWVIGDNPRVAYFPYLQPLRRYAVAIDGEVRAADGSVLPGSIECEAASQAMPPAFYFASRGVVLPPAQNGGLPIVTVNVPEVDVQFLRLRDAEVPNFYGNVLGVRRTTAGNNANGGDEGDDDEWGYSSNRSLQGAVSMWDLDRLGKMTDSVYSGRFVTAPQPDRRHLTFLPVEDITELQQPGIYVAVMTRPGRFQYESQVSYFYVSDIGVHAHRHPEQIDVFATSLKTGQALRGTEFRLIDAQGKELARRTTDAQGQARFDGAYDTARLLTATRGAEQTFIALQQPALDLSEFQARGQPPSTNRLFAYAGRDLYRPGETFQLSLLVRGTDGQPLAALPVTASLKRPDGRIMRTDTWQPAIAKTKQAPGYFVHDIALPVDAPTGTWQLELRLDPASKIPDTTWRFQVEEFLPERMKLTLEPSALMPLADEPLSVAVQGDYLYGAPAAGNRLLVRMSVERQRQALAQTWPGFLFGDVADDDRHQWTELEERELDDQGQAEVSLPIDLEDAHSPMQVTASFSLLESGGRPVIRSAQATVWPADALIAVRPLFNNDVSQDQSLAQFEAARVRRDGTLAPLAQAQLRLFREHREYYWRFDDQGGWNSGYVETDELVDSREIDLTERRQFSLPVRWGRYRLEITDPELDQTLRYRFYAGWGAQDAEAMGNRPDRVQLRLNPTPARPGEDLNVHIAPPHDGEALVTLEADGVLWSRRLAVSAAGTDLRIPLDAAWQRHNLYVSAIVFRPGVQGESRATPARAVGLVHVPLDRSARQLQVSLGAPAKVKPETRTNVTVQASGSHADQAWVTLYAVDAGILSVTNYTTPDPFQYFFGQQRYGAEMLDMYGRLIEKMQGERASLKWGGDSAQRDTRNLPPKVRLVDIFHGPVALDENGAATIPVDLPDFNGTLRLMAAAFTKEDYGTAEREITVAAPVVAELSMPRFLGAGDQAVVALDLTNLTDADRNLAVSLKVDAPLQVQEGARSVRLNAGERKIEHFTLTAEAAGDALLTLSVNATDPGEAISVARRSTLSVQPTTPLLQRTRRLRLAPDEQLALVPGDTADLLLANSVTLGVAASGSSPLHIARLVQDLLNYPYGCTEQTASAAYPFLLLDVADAARLGLNGMTLEQRDARLRSALPRIAAAQSSAGGFSLWQGGAASDIWLTAYVLQFLQDASSAGYPMQRDMLERARNWLLQRLQEAQYRFPNLPTKLATHQPDDAYSQADYALVRDSHQRFAALAYAGYVLAREQSAPLAALRQLYDNYADRARSPLPLVMLAAALRLTGDQQRSNQALDTAMTRPYGIDARRAAYSEWLGDYGSAIRDYAWAYALMHQHDLQHDRRETLLVDLDSQLNGRAWLSTQEQLALVRASLATQADESVPWSLRIRTDQRQAELAVGALEAVTLSGAAALDATAINPGQAPVFVEANLRGHLRPGEQLPAAGAHIVRTWYTPDGEPWTGGELHTGDTLIVGLTASADVAIANALIVDWVPAAFEIENLNLVNDDTMNYQEFGGTRLIDGLTDPRMAYREFRDDRFVAAFTIDKPVTTFYRVRVVNPGQYRVPPATVEDMYRPEIRATSTDTETLTVVAPDRG